MAQSCQSSSIHRRHGVPGIQKETKQDGWGIAPGERGLWMTIIWAKVLPERSAGSAELAARTDQPASCRAERADSITTYGTV